MATRQDPGFTLIECLATMAIVCLLGYAASLPIRSLDQALVKAELNKLTHTCYYLQQRALTNNETYVLTFDVPNNTYSFEKTTIPLTSLHFDAPASAKGPPSCPTHTITSPVTFRDHRILFSPHGIMSAGTVYLQSRSSDVYALSCAVAHTSYVRMYTYNGKWRLW